ncbi:NitT/TauT family transport system permease protein/putative hydroxymethylpyrimidine transport system permease protein [Arboricoccus pini]|uniref:NitT/TauT family transport system permease protein/putative hydroxymethylpyrimidine transport system permease protein n=1 Tax=Arboricoccus pini TaxID=1963835 RepID=A0A212RY61_9PROT|nr:ABC transporter permease [Arboricoccus pini]SNB77729.1 NitT/TauT family transport system permease protein/putative hydroxymethylpyrimidine transport system permease protein [Arboricoccus pini]
MRSGFNLAAFKTPLFFLATCLVIGVVWHLLIKVFAIPPYLVPEPPTVLEGALANSGVLASRTAFTLTSGLLGLALSTVLAAAVAGLYVAFPRAEQASMPIVLAFRSAPVAAVAPIIMMMLGRGISASILVVVIVSIFPLLINLMRGMRAAEPTTLELLHVYNASIWQQLRYVRLPSAMPYLFTGLRIAGTTALLGAMLSEWITGSRGLGLLILDSGEMRDIALLWAAVLLSILLALSMFWITSSLEQRLSRWRRVGAAGLSS